MINDAVPCPEGVDEEEWRQAERFRKDCKGIPISGLSVIPMLNRVCNENGYALTLHGSFAKDYDFLAVPWVEGAASPVFLLECIVNALRGYVASTIDVHPDKPHGRRSYTIHMGHGQWIDLGIMPRLYEGKKDV